MAGPARRHRPAARALAGRRGPHHPDRRVSRRQPAVVPVRRPERRAGPVACLAAAALRARRRPSLRLDPLLRDRVRRRGVIVVDTCVGNDKRRAIAMWNDLHGPFLEDFERCRLRARVGSTSSSAPTCTSITSAGTPAGSTAAGCRPSATPGYLFARIEYEHWQAAGDDDERQVHCRFGPPGARRRSRRLGGERPRRHRRGAARADARAHAGPRQRAHPLAGRRGGHHRRPDAPSDPVLRTRGRSPLRRRSGAGPRDAPALPARAGGAPGARARHPLSRAPTAGWIVPAGEAWQFAVTRPE